MRRSSCSGRAKTILPTILPSRRNHGLKAGIDAQGKLTAWRHHFVTFGDGKHSHPAAALERTVIRLAFPPAYALYTSAQPLMLRTGALRAPGDNAYCWVSQSFLDEWRMRPDATRSSFNSSC